MKIHQNVYDIFSKKGFSQPEIFNLNNLNLLCYKKQLLSVDNIIKYRESILISFGTFFYSGLEYRDGLHKFLLEFLENNIDHSNYKGSFFNLIYHEGRVHFITDASGIQNIFINYETGIISSSLLACIAGTSAHLGKLTLDKLSVIENLLTGYISGCDTIVDEVKRYVTNTDYDLPGILKIKSKKIIPENAPENFEGQVKFQNESLNEYFTSINSNSKRFGILTGLTGGFDSRLLLFHLKNVTNNFEVFSTSRENPTLEFECARNLSDSLGLKLLSPPHRSYNELNGKEFIDLVRGNFYFNDGLIRIYQLWIEEIKSREYLMELYNNTKIGMSGIGGEQYRNNEYLLNNNYNIREWIYYELIYKNCGDVFYLEDDRDSFMEFLISKTKRLIYSGNKDQGTQFSFFNIKKYYNEVFNPAVRTVRNNIENQIAFYLSPFSDVIVSQNAYQLIPFLGLSHGFEKEMINQVAPEYSNIKTDYGYSISEKVPLKYSILPIVKNLFGIKNFNRFYFTKKRIKGSEYFDLERTHPAVTKYTENLKMLNLGLNLENLKKSNLLSPLLFETGFFLEEMSDYIRYDS